MGMKTDKESMSKGIMTWPKEDIQAHIGFMIAFNKELKEGGRVGIGRRAGVSRSGQARAGRQGRDADHRWRVSRNRKEFLVGYWIVDVESPERAYPIAAQASAAPGPGGRAEHADRSAAGDERGRRKNRGDACGHSSTCCANWRRRCSARCPPLSRFRRRRRRGAGGAACGRRRNGRAKAFRTIRAPG